MDQSAINKLIAAHKPGHALDRPFYTSESIYQRDIERIYMRSWLYAGHISEIPAQGDYLLFEFAKESVIIVHSDTGEISALLNVCRHRGSRVCLANEGKTAKFTCPYHGWTYALNGELRGAAHMDRDFDKNAYGLRKVHMQILAGLIFVNFSQSPANFDAVADDLCEALKPYNLEAAKVAHRQSYHIEGNWKLAIENYTECYHCAPAHPEYSRGHALAQGKASMQVQLEELMEKSQHCGLSNKTIDNSFLRTRDFGTDTAFTRYPMIRGHVTGSKDGTPIAPLLGTVTQYDGGCTDFQVGPVSFALAYCDHIVIYRFTPVDVSNSVCDITWLLRGDATEGEDYDRDKLVWLWDITTKADKVIIENNQLGINSRYYTPGPYSSMEEFTARFIDWYLHSIVRTSAD